MKKLLLALAWLLSVCCFTCYAQTIRCTSNTPIPASTTTVTASLCSGAAVGDFAIVQAAQGGTFGSAFSGPGFVNMWTTLYQDSGTPFTAGAEEPALTNHTSAGAGTTSAVSMTGANFIAIFENVQWGSSPVVPTDSSGNTYTLAAQQLAPGNTGTYLYVTYAPTVTGSMTFTASNGWPFAVMGFSSVASFDKSTGASCSGPCVPGPITPTNAHELVLSGFGGQNSGSSITATSSPLTLVDNQQGSGGAAGYGSAADAYVVQGGSASPVSNTWTNNACCGTAGLIAAFYSTLAPATLAIASTAVPEGFVSHSYTGTGSLYSNQLAATGGVQPYVWTITSGTLPTGMSLSSGGLLSGTPTGTVSARSITYEVTDAQSNTQTVTLPITIAATAFSANAGTCTGSALNGTQYTSFGGCGLAAAGGTSPYNFVYSTAQNTYTLPEGLSLTASTGAIPSSTIYGTGDYPVTFITTDSLGTFADQTITFPIAGNYTMSGWTLFPNDSVFHLNVSSLPVDTSVAAPLLSAYTSTGITMETDVNTGGIPYAHWPASQANATVVTQWPGYGVDANFAPYTLLSPDTTSVSHNSTQSDRVSPFATIEATQNNSCSATVDDYCGDGHSISVILPGGGNPTRLLEQYNAQFITNWTNHADGNWDMSGYTMPLQDVGEATDAAGLPVAPFLVTYDEAAAGTINHAMRFILQGTLNYHVWPATAQAGGGACTGGYEDSNHLILQPGSPGGGPPTGGCSGGPMGEIYRLPASFNSSSICVGNTIAKNIITAWYNYGIILADNGSTGTITAAADSRWPNLSCLNAVLLGDFEPVNVQSAIKTLTMTTNLPTVSYQTTVGLPTAATPTFSPVAGTYSSTQMVTISTATGGATLCYTTDGSTPLAATPGTCSHGTTYSTPVTVASSLTLSAIATEASFANSTVGTAGYVITTSAATPTFSPVAGTYAGTQSVTISTSAGTVICYNTTGSPATNGTTGCTTGTLYTTPVSVASSETLFAVAGGTGFIDSSVGSAAYVIHGAAATPTFSPVAGSYVGTQSVTLSTATSGCAASLVWNTTNAQSGGNLTGTSSTNPLSVASSETVYAQVQSCPTYVNSAIGSAAYTINPTTPIVTIQGSITITAPTATPVTIP